MTDDILSDTTASWVLTPHEDDVSVVGHLNDIVRAHYGGQGYALAPYKFREVGALSTHWNAPEYFVMHSKGMEPSNLVMYVNSLKWYHPETLVIMYRITARMKAWEIIAYDGSAFVMSPEGS